MMELAQCGCDAAQRAEFRVALTDLVQRAPATSIRGWFFCEVTANRWMPTDIGLKPGDWVTTLASGSSDVTPTLSIRVGENGAVLCNTGRTHSFLAFDAGELYLARDWEGTISEPGSVMPTNALPAPVIVAVLLWNGPTLRGLKQLVRFGDVDGLISAEIERIRNADMLTDDVRSMQR